MMDPRAEGATIHSLPQAFINKRGDAILANMLDDKLSQRLVDMYLAFEPRNSFQGLPPISDAACVNWVRQMIDTGINLIALSFEAGLVGHSALFPVNERVCELLAVVSPAFQDVGIGTELTRCAIQLAHELGYETVQLSVEVSNSRAQHVYKKCGFDYKYYDLAGEVEMALDLRRYRDLASICVTEIMNRDVLAIRQNESCRDALDVFLSFHIDILPVVDEQGKLLGILSNSDLMLPSQIDRKVGDIFTRQVLTVEKGCTIARVIRMLHFKKIHGICVVDGQGKLVGVIGPEQILAYYDEQF